MASSASALLSSLEGTLSLARAALSSTTSLYDPASYPSSLHPAAAPLPLVDVLAVKSSLLANYMSDLSSFLVLRCGDAEATLSATSTSSAAASLSSLASSRLAVQRRLNEQRVALQKLRPLEKRTQYATAKLADRGKRFGEDGEAGVQEGEEGAMRARPEAFGQDEGDDEEGLSDKKKKKKKKNDKNKKNKNDDDDDDDDDAAQSDDDELSELKKLVSGKVSAPSSVGASSSSSSKSSSSVYSAPRLSSVLYDGDKKSAASDRRRAKDLEKLGRSDVLQSLRREFGDRPDVAGTDGVTDGGKGGRGTAAEKLGEMQDEKRRFEEERFMRFVDSREEKKLKRKLERDQMSIGALTDFGSFTNNVDELERLGKRDERRRKNEDSGGGGDDDDGDGNGGKNKRHANGKRVRGGGDINVDGDDAHKKKKKGGGKGNNMNDLQKELYGGGGGGGGGMKGGFAKKKK